MRLLLFSDLHCDHAAASRLVGQAESVDVAVGAGDFGVQRRGVSDLIDVLRAMPCPTVVVPGNGESDGELREACAGWAGVHVLHGESVTLDGVAFFGIGGGIPVTPFGPWSFDLTEEQAREMLGGCPPGAVLVSHSPPRDTCDLDDGGVPRGSLAVREAVVRSRPRLVVCGHIHASWERRGRVGDTPVVNAGPRGVVYELERRLPA